MKTGLRSKTIALMENYIQTLELGTIAWPFVAFDAAQLPYTVVNFVFSGADDITLAAEQRTLLGTLSFSVVSGATGLIGTGEGDAIADTIENNFYAGLKLDGDDVRVEFTEHPFAGNGYQDGTSGQSGSRWRIPISVPFRASYL